MAVLLVSLSLMGLLMSMALPVWSQQARREREAELIFRGEQYARAIALYQRRQPGAFPSDLDMLVEQRYLRRKYGDPMMGGGAFRLLRQSDQPAPGLGGGSDRHRRGDGPGRCGDGFGRRPRRFAESEPEAATGTATGAASRAASSAW